MSVNFVRLSLNRELSEDELDSFLSIVEDFSRIKTYVGTDKDDENFTVSVFDDSDNIYYQVLVEDAIIEEDAELIIKEISGIITDDFEFEIG